MPDLGETAPDFTLPNTEKKPLSLRDFRGKKLVLAFYPGAFTGTCTREMCALRDSLSVLGNSGANVLAISVDTPFANRGFAGKNGLVFPFLSDYRREVIAKYGIVLKNFSGLEGYEVAKRSVFVLDKDGRVTYRWVSEDAGKEPPNDEVIKAAQATP